MGKVQVTQNSLPMMLGQYAGFVTRLVAFIIDQIIIGTVIAISVAVGTFILQSIPKGLWPALDQGVISLGLLVSAAIAIIVPLLYFLVLWMLAGQTLGKALMGVRIVRTDGTRLRFGNCIRRLVGYWLSAFLFWGYLLVLVDNRRQGGHDKFAGTFVVYSWPDSGAKTKPVLDRMRIFGENRKADQAAAAESESSPAS